MTLDRAIAGIFLVLCLVYGYTAFVTMENGLLPFERNMVFLPNTMPKWLSVLGVIIGTIVLIQTGPKAQIQINDGEINYRNIRHYKLTQAILLIVLMISYALLLRPIGFIGATTMFLTVGGIVLGERRFKFLLPVAILATFIIWYLVQELLDIFLKPWPSFF